MIVTEPESWILTEGTARKLMSTATITVDWYYEVKKKPTSENRNTHIQCDTWPFTAQPGCKVLPARRVGSAFIPYSSEYSHMWLWGPEHCNVESPWKN
jgi:hypothetical protein